MAVIVKKSIPGTKPFTKRSISTSVIYQVEPYTNNYSLTASGCLLNKGILSVNLVRPPAATALL